MSDQLHIGPPFLLHQHHTIFPDPNLALTEPDGLLAVGGDLSRKRLLSAYQQGVFPWFSDQQPILWWSPDPRCVVYPQQLKVSRSMNKTLRKGEYTITLDNAFEHVMRECAAPRGDQQGTWITDEMFQAYSELHRQGDAHSAECWYQDELVGGLYGIAIGRVFFGESMFSRRSNASKAAFISLVQQLIDWGYQLIDCQLQSDHLMSLGAVVIPRATFLQQLHMHCQQQPNENAWRKK
ncbi:MAG: leucyl/phenylalanyl-tRNA--protein transferase [Gammaproteobacteria bacterium]|nr:leucyl/phenylalanyl-tRNA--protein transferase [Gammaproteobacteria bacterium]MCF6229533.1 leucyl/phenylalanyl-tRNA--protein transferase [Gammaproteobacteria bacterium]